MILQQGVRGATSSFFPWLKDMRICRLRFYLKPKFTTRPGLFPGPEMRGALGHKLKISMGCHGNSNEDCRNCPTTQNANCAYVPFFVHGNHDSKGMFLRIDPRLSICGGEGVQEGETLWVDMVLLGRHIAFAGRILTEIGNNPFEVFGEGFHFELAGAGFLDGEGLFRTQAEADKIPHDGYLVVSPSPPLQIPMNSSSLRIEFLTPTEVVRTHNKRVERPEDLDFQLLVRKIVARIADLSEISAGAPKNRTEKSNPAIRALIESAGEVVLVESHGAQWKKVRYRNKPERLGGGIVGPLVFKGNLSPFLDLLDAGALLGIGKGTTAGFGDMRFMLL